MVMKVVSRLKIKANEFNDDEELVKMAKACIKDTKGQASIPAALTHLTNVVQRFFECNEQGEGKIVIRERTTRIGESSRNVLDDMQCSIK